MGLFSIFKKTSDKKKFRNDIERDMYKKNIAGYRELKDQVDYQDDLYERINAIHNKYKSVSDIEGYIDALEHIITSDPESEKQVCLKLVDLYIKAGRNDTAWGYLNKLLIKNYDIKHKIRFEQARSLKKEKKYGDAILHYMLGYLDKSKWNNTFQADMFAKDIKSSANRLKWGDDRIRHLSSLIEKQVKKRNYDEEIIIKSYKRALEEWNGKG